MEAEKITGSEIIMQIGKKIYPGFNLDDPYRRSIYEQMFYILSGNDKVQSFGHKKDRGALLLGDIGVGKTIMMKTMQTAFKDTPRRFMWVNCLAFKDMLDEGMKPVEIKFLYGKSLKCDLYIDDLGLGQVEYRDYGNVTNVVGEILFERDELFISDGYLTHMSSNIPTTVPAESGPAKKSLERLYGDRVLDRMKQMNNLIVWKGKSLRGQ